MSNPIVQSFFHEPTCTATHLVQDPATKRAAIVDPVLDIQTLNPDEAKAAILDETLLAALAPKG